MRWRIFVLFVASVLSFAASAQFVAGQESLLEEPLDFKSALELARKGEARGFYQLAIKFPRREEGTGGCPSWFGEIGRYNVNAGIGKMNDMPHIHLSIADRDVSRQTVVPAGIKLKLPANAGSDVL